jgi:excinuclease UvrABC ATPase subunit
MSLGTQTNTSPCPHCKGTGSVVVKDAKGNDETKPCPVCKGSRTSGGLMTK